MAFMNFLKKKTISSDDSLDAPPIPPPGEPDLEDLPDFPAIKRPKNDLPGFPFIEESNESMPDFPAARWAKEEKQPSTKPDIGKIKPLIPPARPLPKKEEKLTGAPLFKKIDELQPDFAITQKSVPEPKKLPAASEISKKPGIGALEPQADNKLFIKLERYKNALMDIELVKKDTKKLQAALKEIDELMINTKDKFDKYKGAIDAIEQKVNYLNNKLMG